MVRLTSLPPDVAAEWRDADLPSFPSNPWVTPPPMSEACVAIVSTAGLHVRSDSRFGRGAADYRLIPGDIAEGDLVMSHTSVNFDRSGFAQDVNVVFPIGPLRELAERGEIGSIAGWHYSFMGATHPTRMVDTGPMVGRLLRSDGVTAALLVPV